MSTVNGNVFADTTVNGFSPGTTTFTLNVAATNALANGIDNPAGFMIDANGNLSYTSTQDEEGETVCAVVDAVTTDPNDCGCTTQFEVCMQPEVDCSDLSHNGPTINADCVTTLSEAEIMANTTGFGPNVTITTSASTVGTIDQVGNTITITADESHENTTRFLTICVSDDDKPECPAQCATYAFSYGSFCSGFDIANYTM